MVLARVISVTQRRRKQSGYLLCEWVAALLVMLVLMTAISVPAVTQWQEQIVFERTVQAIYLYMIRVQSHASTSVYGRDGTVPSFQVSGHEIVMRAGIKQWEDTRLEIPSHMQLYSPYRMYFGKFGHLVGTTGYTIVLYNPRCHRWARFIVAEQTGRIRIERGKDDTLPFTAEGEER